MSENISWRHVYATCLPYFQGFEDDDLQHCRQGDPKQLFGLVNGDIDLDRFLLPEEEKIKGANKAFYAVLLQRELPERPQHELSLN